MADFTADLKPFSFPRILRTILRRIVRPSYGSELARRVLAVRSPKGVCMGSVPKLPHPLAGEVLGALSSFFGVFFGKVFFTGF